MQYELLIKGGEVVDPAQGIRSQQDIAISQGKIAALAPNIATNEAVRIIDAKGKIVTSGLIDIHAHVAGGLVQSAVSPDEAGVLSGVTTVCDAGSTGYANFLGFKKFILPQARTDVFCFLNLCSTGLALMPELTSWNSVNLEAMLETITKNRDIIKGIKLRAIGALAQSLGLGAVKAAKKLASEVRLPLLVHVGIDPSESGDSALVKRADAFTRELLPLLDKGDILTHIYTWKAGGVIEGNGMVLPELKEAMERGVVLDAAQGFTSTSFEIAKIGLAKGILPNTLSTDLTVDTINDPGCNLTVIMSKFLSLGLTLDQVITMTTVNPARALDEEHKRGNLRIGTTADITILELTEGDFLFSDGKAGNSLKGKHLLVPKFTIKAGVEIIAQPLGRIPQAGV